jgi:hypothetical protein
MSKWTPEQQAEHRRAWIEALRSRKYKQTKCTLRSTNADDKGFSYCCLGVACDLYLKSGDAPEYMNWLQDNSFAFAEPKYSDPYSDDVELPQPVMDWLGLKTCNGHYENTSLVSNNDCGMPFKKIADIIESEPEGLLI